jgi:phenylpropionate dioxygenase-like ring-hydroxylating dioxygenase large terminal subunit
MFIHDRQLEHLLPPAQYYDAGRYQVELERLFRPAWHVVAARSDLPRPGDYLTLDLLGQPLLVRNIDGEIHTFLNVCAHRHCQLTSQPRGHSERLRCQYHGWEYGPDGRTGRIPDAGCFRPFDRENAQLKKMRTQVHGELVFVSLADEGPDLKEFLGPYCYDFCGACTGDFRLRWTWETEYQANWKVPIENSLESYHIPCLHSKTFGELPPEETSRHDLGERSTTFWTAEPARAVRIRAWLVRRLGAPVTSTYIHHHTHPHITLASLDLMRLVQIILPLSPRTCRHRVWLFTLRGSRRNPLARTIGSLLSWLTKLIARQVILEDAPIFAAMQRGLEASPHPGVIGTREERVFAFQDYVSRACS